MKYFIILFLVLSTFLSAQSYITIPDKNTNDQFTAAELNQILDAIKDGTLSIRTASITINGIDYTIIATPSDISDSLRIAADSTALKLLEGSVGSVSNLLERANGDGYGGGEFVMKDSAWATDQKNIFNASNGLQQVRRYGFNFDPNTGASYGGLLAPDTAVQALGWGHGDNTPFEFKANAGTYATGIRPYFSLPAADTTTQYTQGMEMRMHIDKGGVGGGAFIEANAIVGGLFLNSDYIATRTAAVFGAPLLTKTNAIYSWTRRIIGVQGQVHHWAAGTYGEVEIGIWGRRAQFTGAGDTYPTNNYAILSDGMLGIVGDGDAHEDTTGAFINFREDIQNSSNNQVSIGANSGDFKVKNDTGAVNLYVAKEGWVGMGLNIGYPVSVFEMTANNNGIPMTMRNNDVNGYVGFNLYDNGNTLRTSFVYSNASASVFSGEVWLGMRSTDDFIIATSGTTERMRVTNAGAITIGAGSLEPSAGSSRTLSLQQIAGGDPTVTATTATLYTIDDGTDTHLMAKNDAGNRVYLTSFGIAAFTTTAQHDTVIIDNTTVASIFNISVKEVSPIADDFCTYTTKADTLIVHRNTGTTSGLVYTWQRLK